MWIILLIDLRFF